MGLTILKLTGHPVMSLSHQEGAPVPSPLPGLHPVAIEPCPAGHSPVHLGLELL